MITSKMEVMYVVKRDNRKETVSFDKVSNRLKKLVYMSDPPLSVDYIKLAQKVCMDIYSGVTTSELDELAAQMSAAKTTEHFHYGILASRLAISNHHKKTSPSFSETVELLRNSVNQKGDVQSVVSDEFYSLVLAHKEKLNSVIDYSRDYDIDYFGFKTLEKSYFLKASGKIVERPQHVFMRVALAIHKSSMRDVVECYTALSLKKCIHATPTLYNAGTTHGQLASCFLLGTNEDSIDSIYNSVKDCALISKSCGGIGMHISNVRANGSNINGGLGKSDGIVPMLKVFNETGKYVNQGSRRAGSFAIYLEPWHKDVIDFLDLKKNNGVESMRARDLFYALWIPDLFMKRVENNLHWTLMCPYECPHLTDTYGEAFEELYVKYENEGKGKRMNARDLWFKILDSQIETGTPYMLYKDACNIKSNQKNIGTIKSSNLCVHPNTKILTKKGYYDIIDLENKEVEVWNGKKWSKTIPKKTGENQPVVEVFFSNGMSVKCTPYHKFYIETASEFSYKSNPKIVEAKDLEKNMKIIKFNVEMGEESDVSMKYPYESGLLCFQARINEEDGVIARVSKDNHKVLQYLKNNCSLRKTLQNFIDFEIPLDMDEYVPINDCLDTKLRWLEGFFDGNSTLVNHQGMKLIYLKSYDKKTVEEVLLLLQTIGITSSFSSNDKMEYELRIDSKNLMKLQEIGFSPKRIDITKNRNPLIPINKYIKIADVVDNKEFSDTYCFTEEEEHKGIFNGVLLGNCTEIIEYSGPGETAVCNLASVALSQFVLPPNISGKITVSTKKDCVYCSLLKNWCEKWNILYTEIERKEERYPQVYVDDEKVGGYLEFLEKYPCEYNFEELEKTSRLLTKNLNKVIENTTYPLESARYSNMRHRPIGLCVQGLADVFFKMKIPFDSKRAKILNANIFESIYYGALDESSSLAKELGPYDSYDGSPISHGILQQDMWGPSDILEHKNWTELREKIKKYGVRNSLLVSPAPTASTASILGNNECFEVITSNIYVRRVLAGEFIMMNKYLQEDLRVIGIYDDKIKDQILLDEGSVKNLQIPQFLKDIYKTVWEIKQKVLIDYSADRGRYICQSQSLNLFQENPQSNKLSAMHFYAWKKGLKTGLYYLRTKAVSKTAQFTIAPKIEKKEPEVCESCSG